MTQKWVEGKLLQDKNDFWLLKRKAILKCSCQLANTLSKSVNVGQLAFAAQEHKAQKQKASALCSRMATLDIAYA